jgi:hypothetical protein
MIKKTIRLITDIDTRYYYLPDNIYDHVICSGFIQNFINKRPEGIKVTVSDQPQEGFTKATIIYFEGSVFDNYDIDLIEVNSRRFATLHSLDKLIFETFPEGIKQFYFKIEEVSS